MSWTINHNLMALNIARNLGNHYQELSVSTQRLSSGLRINSSADDAAGLAVRELMRADISTLNQGIRNANDAISMIQTADGALQIIDEKLIRMNELAEQAATGTYTSDQRMIIDSEFQAMANEIQRISNATDYNGISLLNGQELVFDQDKNSFNSNLIAYWPFNYSFQDVTQNNQYMFSSNVQFGTKDGKTGAYFNRNNGSFDMVMYGVHSDAATYSAWVNLDSTASNAGAYLRTIFNQETGVTGTANNFKLGINGDNAIVFGLSDDSQVITTASNAAIPNGWHLITASVDGPGHSLKIYVDGSIKAQGSYTGDVQEPIANEGYTFIGSDLDGYLSDFRVYDHSLSQQDILKLMKAPQGVVGKNIDVQFGLSNRPSEDSYNIFFQSSTLQELGVYGCDISTQENAQSSLDILKTAMINKDNIRASLGAIQNRLENTISNLQIQAENLQKAESQISDTDVAEEMTNFVHEQILTQAATAMLTQANSFPKIVLQLITG